ncbi:hypothetical protein KFE80_00265 [bacterium SCSIO 12696]|nr:hypothetical protein KFE80_00265 [bacterium SCSIO 12696]
MRIIVFIFAIFSASCFADMVSHCKAMKYEKNVELMYEIAFEDEALKSNIFNIKAIAPKSVLGRPLENINFQSNTGGINVPMAYEETKKGITTSFSISNSDINHTYIVAYYGLKENGCPILLGTRVTNAK